MVGFRKKANDLRYANLFPFEEKGAQLKIMSSESKKTTFTVDSFNTYIGLVRMCSSKVKIRENVMCFKIYLFKYMLNRCLGSQIENNHLMETVL